jgi:copper chaperone
LAGVAKREWKNTEEDTMKTIKIKGMSCHHCVMAVSRALQAIDGVDQVQVSLDTGEATFEETAPVDMTVIAEKIRKAGYNVV